MKILKRFLWLLIGIIYITPGFLFIVPFTGIDNYVLYFDNIYNNFK